MASLHEYLNDERRTIIERWRESALKDNSLRAVNSLSFHQFEDHIPAVLDALEKRLADPQGHSEISGEDTERRLAKHGVSRWQQGYKLSEVAQDWLHLHMAILSVIEDCLNTGSAPADIPGVYREVAAMMHKGALESTREYEWLQHAEATAHLEEIKGNLLMQGSVAEADTLHYQHLIHDLRHEVTLVAGATKLFDGKLDAKSKALAIKCMRQGVSSLDAMLGDMMVLARLNSGSEKLRFSLLDPAGFVEDILAKCRPAAEEMGMTLAGSGDSIPEVKTDKAKLTRVVQNLIVNALKHVRQGEIRVSWGASPLKDHWFIRVEDNGPGLSRVSMAFLGEGSNNGSGTAAPVTCQNEGTDDPVRSSDGLGLSIVKRLCEVLNAALEVDTDYTEGTRITVHLPYKYAPEETSRP